MMVWRGYIGNFPSPRFSKVLKCSIYKLESVCDVINLHFGSRFEDYFCQEKARLMSEDVFSFEVNARLF